MEKAVKEHILSLYQELIFRYRHTHTNRK